MYDDLTIAENLRFFARILGVDDDRVATCLELVSLADRADSVVSQLSGGQRSRVSLAVALLDEPRLLVLDEPTVGLDPVLRVELWETFHELAAAGAAVLVSSHVMDEASRCERLLLMREGRFIADDTPDGLLPSYPRRRHRGRVPRDRAGLRRHREGRGTPMNPMSTLAVASRVLTQVRRDHRTLAMLLVLPCALMTLLWWMFNDLPGTGFDDLGPALLALVPFVIMFLVTSVTTLRERTSGTLERLLAMPMGKLDFLLGYAVAFGILAAFQSALAVALCVWVLDLSIVGTSWLLMVVAVVDAVLGTALGLFVSAFARTEFQAVQFMPALVIPQILLCGLFVPRDQLPPVLEAISNVLPLSYAVDAMQDVAASTATADVWRNVLLVAAFALAGLALGALTLRRQTA